jgi:outer membrane protein assembly factor BamA
MRQIVYFAMLLGALLLAIPAAEAQQLSIRPVIGGLTAGSGFDAGVELRRSGVHLKAIGSLKKYQFLELGFDVPELGRPWLSFQIAGRYRNYPQEHFWGLGQNTREDQQTNYLYEDIGGDAVLAIRAGKIRTGVSAGYLAINTGRGRDRQFPSVPESLQSSPRYLPIGSFFEYDSTDEKSDPRAGGKYAFRWTRYGNAFHRYEIDVRRFLPLTERDRIALRMTTAFTDPSAHHETPFFMLPYAGGSSTVRGFDHYRFRDRDALVMNAEYRRPLTGFLDAVIFADAGRVFSRASDFTFKHLATAGGLGTRVRFGDRMFFGVDVAFSREGQRLWFRSEHMF